MKNYWKILICGKFNRKRFMINIIYYIIDNKIFYSIFEKIYHFIYDKIRYFINITILLINNLLSVLILYIHALIVTNSIHHLIARSLRFASTHKGADSLMEFISRNIGNSPCIFGMEATGHYWYSIYSFLKSKGYTLYVINPIQSDSLRKIYIRQTKNGAKASFLIAEVIRSGQFTTTSMADENILAMRQLCRYRDSVISSRTEIRLRICTIMEQIFPEYGKEFSSLWLNTPMSILEKYLTPKNIADTPIDELFSIIKNKSHNKLTMKKAVSIKEAATDTFGIKIAQEAFSFQLKQLIDRLHFLDEQIETLEMEIIKYYKNLIVIFIQFQE